ncbi:MAG: hypothetical protein AAAB16_19390 [Pseudomonas sp.]|uniref:hypothetical protein n=1 Tax=Pseudomonas sp. TaxID=306 RepID=UPI0030F30F45
MKKLAATFFMAWMSFATASDERFSMEDQGKFFIEQLATEITQAERIVVTEHSNRFDTADPNADHTPIIYRAHTLDTAEKTYFLNTVNALDPETKNGFAGCIFVPHHTIQFYSQTRLTSTLEVCFECGDIDWSGLHPTQPWALVGGVGKLINKIGFATERDWKSLATSR